MQNKQWSNEYRTTLICIDSCQNGVLTGRLYNPYVPRGERFHSLLGLLLRMEKLLDQMLFPQPYTIRRAFGEPQPLPNEIPRGDEGKRGACATFAVRVLFRQNASWQGSVQWIEGAREESFRSALELIHLLSSALPNVRDQVS